MKYTRKDLIRKWKMVDKRIEESVCLLKWLADRYETKPEKQEQVKKFADVLEEFYIAMHTFWKTYC
ncbi:MAG: hypothetical protein DRH24_06515 [Deltaproteobacteria bacterium]|nr:MAG: hypothetical protein DRH24_06515 [Deltaproteobacteria bacterium]